MPRNSLRVFFFFLISVLAAPVLCKLMLNHMNTNHETSPQGHEGLAPGSGLSLSQAGVLEGSQLGVLR